MTAGLAAGQFATCTKIRGAQRRREIFAMLNLTQRIPWSERASEQASLLLLTFANAIADRKHTLKRGLQTGKGVVCKRIASCTRTGECKIDPRARISAGARGIERDYR